MKISRRYNFEAAHFLPSLPVGHKCRRMHGHSYTLEWRISGELDEDGLCAGVEFGALDVWMAPLLDLVDHHLWNDKLECPTIENIALWFLEFFKDAKRGMPCKPSKVICRVYEGPRSWAEVYWEPQA
jgi:6-pyruvoyltetrahydropterin/6-carboxytetrahydropterin synthase